MKEDHPGEFVAIEGLPVEVVAIEARRFITARDYKDTLLSLVQSKLEAQDKLKFLLVAGAGVELRACSGR